MSKRKQGVTFDLPDSTVDRILMAGDPQSRQAWLITAATPGEGATTIAWALSRSLADRKKKVMLLDGDLRSPQLHDRLNVERAPGLAEIVLEGRSIDDVVRPVGFDGRLGFVSAGKAVPDLYELFASPHWADFLAEAKRRFDFVVIDSSALESSLDAVQLGRLADGVLMVVRSGKTSKQHLRKATTQLIEGGANVRGVVVNQYRDFVPRFVRRLLHIEPLSSAVS